MFRFSVGSIAFAIALIGILFASCNQNTIYTSSKLFPQSVGWRYADTADFVVSIPDTNHIYNLYLDVEHDKDFPTQNAYLRVSTRFPSGQRISEQLSVELADGAGKWLGSGWGERKTLHLPIQKGAYFNQAGKYTFTVGQWMRQDSVKHIHSIGFRVESTGETREGSKKAKK